MQNFVKDMEIPLHIKNKSEKALYNISFYLANLAYLITFIAHFVSLFYSIRKFSNIHIRKLHERSTC